MLESELPVTCNIQYNTYNFGHICRHFASICKQLYHITEIVCKYRILSFRGFCKPDQNLRSSFVKASLCLQSVRKYCKNTIVLEAVMWIRIDRIRIRIHKTWSIRIQVNKITKFLLIFKSKKKRYELSEDVAVSKHQHLLFLGSDLKNIISCEKNNIHVG